MDGNGTMTERKKFQGKVESKKDLFIYYMKRQKKQNQFEGFYFF